MSRCAHTIFSRGIERDDEGGVNVSCKNKIEIVCETINERYLQVYLRVYIYDILCVRGVYEKVFVVFCVALKRVIKLS